MGTKNVPQGQGFWTFCPQNGLPGQTHTHTLPPHFNMQRHHLTLVSHSHPAGGLDTNASGIQMRSTKTSCWPHQKQNTGRSRSKNVREMDSQLKMADAGCWVEMGQCSSSLLSPQWLNWSQTCEPRFRHLPLAHWNLHSMGEKNCSDSSLNRLINNN